MSSSEPQPPRAEPDCPVCAGAGWYAEAVPVGHPHFGRLMRCACLPERPDPRLGVLRAQLGRYATLTFEDFHTDPIRRPLTPTVWHGPTPWDATAGDQTIPVERQQLLINAAVRIARHYASAPSGWLYMYGLIGAGKSHLAAAILNDAATRGAVGSYASVSDMLRFVHDGFRDNSASDRLRSLQAIDLLCLDDLRPEYLSTGRNAETLWELLDARYRVQRPTIITANVHPDQLPDRRLASRIVELSERTIFLPLSDYRRRATH